MADGLFVVGVLEAAVGVVAIVVAVGVGDVLFGIDIAVDTVGVGDVSWVFDELVDLAMVVAVETVDRLRITVVVMIDGFFVIRVPK